MVEMGGSRRKRKFQSIIENAKNEFSFWFDQVESQHFAKSKVYEQSIKGNKSLRFELDGYIQDLLNDRQELLIAKALTDSKAYIKDNFMIMPNKQIMTKR